MSIIIRQLSRLHILFWALYIIIAQPGLPACWVELHACEIHVHFSKEQAESPHDHVYLFDLASGYASQPYPAVTLTSWLMIITMACSGPTVRYIKYLKGYDGAGWTSIPDPPPPKLFILLNSPITNRLLA